MQPGALAGPANRPEYSEAARTVPRNTGVMIYRWAEAATYAVPHRVGIIDCDALMDDLAALAKGGLLASLFTQPGGSTRWLAAGSVFTEMYQSDRLGYRNK